MSMYSQPSETLARRSAGDSSLPLRLELPLRSSLLLWPGHGTACFHETESSCFCSPPYVLLCLVSANIQGFSPLITGYLLFIPVLGFSIHPEMASRTARSEPQEYSFPVITFLMLPLILIVWRPSDVNEDRFLDIRDYLLLSNSIGRKVNAFYYENSLYSTRVLRSYGQQLLRSCRLEGMSDPSLTRRMTGILLARDYLPLGSAVRPDLRIALSDKDLEFYSQDELVLKSSMRDFFRNPAEPLKQFEKRTDRHRFLLAFILFSILFLGALFLFVLYLYPILLDIRPLP